MKKLEKSLTERVKVEKRLPGRRNWWKMFWRSYGGTLVVRQENWLFKRVWARLRWWGFSKKTSKHCLTRFRKGMNSHPLTKAWDSKNADSSWNESKKARCPTSCSRMRSNLTSSSPSIRKLTEFGAEQVLLKVGECLGAKTRSQSRFGPLSPSQDDPPWFLYPRAWNWTASATSLTFWIVNCCPGPMSTLQKKNGLFNRTLLPLMGPESLRHGFAATFLGSSVRKNGQLEVLI